MTEIKRIAGTNKSLSQYLFNFSVDRSVIKELCGAIYNSKDSVWYFPIVNSVVVGFGSVRSDTDKNIAWLDYAYVYPEYRKNGLYRELLEARLADIRQSSAIEIRLLTNNKIVIELTEKIGFKTISSRGSWVTMQVML